MTVTIDEKKFTIPQSWNELPLRQQMICYGIIMSDVPISVEAVEVVPFKKIQIIQTLLHTDEAYMKKWAKDCDDVHGEEGKAVFLAELDEVMKVADFLFYTDEETGAKSISLTLTKCPWPYILVQRRGTKGKKEIRWYAPSDRLANITIYELGVTFTIFERYLKEKDAAKQKELARQLIATLYRPTKSKTKKNIRSDYEGDIRLPLRKHETTVEVRAEKIENIPTLTMQLMLFWFASCRQEIINNYPAIFKASGEDSEPDAFGWGAVLLNLADGIVHLDDVADRKYSDALTYLSYMEAQRKKAKNKHLTIA